MEAEIVHYNIPLWAIIPFVLMLLSIAICPLIIPEWWEKNKNKLLVSLLLGIPTAIWMIAKNNKLVVGSQARILYADGEARVKISKAFNEAIKSGYISAPIVLGRDHHDVSGTDSPFRETSNIYDGSKYTADMATHTFVGNAIRGATWVSLHNGGGVGWGEVINGGFGLVLDGSDEADKNLRSMLFWDVINGISRRSWARNPNAMVTLNRALSHHKDLSVTIPNLANDDLINKLFE
jgi:urocanate hydratase